MISKSKLLNMVLSAMFLAIAMVLPFLTGQIPQIGNAMCPMHIPVILCGFICGPQYALCVGLIAPILRFFLFGMPTIMPKGVAMSFELATYGLVSGILYRVLPRKKIYIYVSLVIAMIAGRVIWGLVQLTLMGLGKSPFSWAAFVSGAFLNAIPGIIIQIVIIPVLVILLAKQMEQNK